LINLAFLLSDHTAPDHDRVSGAYGSYY